MPSLAELDLSKNKLIADAVDGPIFNLPHLKILNLVSIYKTFYARKFRLSLASLSSIV
jgi:hypothetical protein